MTHFKTIKPVESNLDDLGFPEIPGKSEPGSQHGVKRRGCLDRWNRLYKVSQVILDKDQHNSICPCLLNHRQGDDEHPTTFSNLKTSAPLGSWRSGLHHHSGQGEWVSLFGWPEGGGRAAQWCLIPMIISSSLSEDKDKPIQMLKMLLGVITLCYTNAVCIIGDLITVFQSWEL